MQRLSESHPQLDSLLNLGALPSTKFGVAEEVGFENLTAPLEEALARGVAGTGGPVVVADQSDNCGGGAPGDATYAWRWLLDRGAEDVATAIFNDPEVVRIARKAGPNARIAVRLGGKLGRASGNPVDVEALVLASRDNYAHGFPQASGAPVMYPAGDIVALRCGGIDIVVSSVRCQCFAPSIFTDLGIDPTRKRMLVVKSTQHFRGAFEPIASEIIYMAAPGGVAPDPRLISYARFDPRGTYPWNEEPFAGLPLPGSR